MIMTRNGSKSGTCGCDHRRSCSRHLVRISVAYAMLAFVGRGIVMAQSQPLAAPITGPSAVPPGFNITRGDRIAFGIDFVHGNPDLSDYDCYGEFLSIKSIIYPVYVMEVMLVAQIQLENITTIDPGVYTLLSKYVKDYNISRSIQKYIHYIFTTQMRYSNVYNVTTNVAMNALNTTLNRRQLLHDDEGPTPMDRDRRQLQAVNCYWYETCTTYTPNQLKLMGCYKKCSRRRKRRHRHLRQKKKTTIPTTTNWCRYQQR